MREIVWSLWSGWKKRKKQTNNKKKKKETKKRKKGIVSFRSDARGIHHATAPHVHNYPLGFNISGV